MSFNLIDFFNPQRLFELQPAISLATVYFLSAVFGLLIVVALAIKIWRRVSRNDALLNNLLDKYFSLLLTMGLIGLVIVWLRYERAYILSARFWLLVWLIVLVAWWMPIWRYQFKTIPQLREKLRKSQEFSKYLPKKK